MHCALQFWSGAVLIIVTGFFLKAVPGMPVFPLPKSIPAGFLTVTRPSSIRAEKVKKK
jgi:hypothetical protein